MGQYWKVVNLDKREFLHPHKLGCGLKLRELVNTQPGPAAALIMLCAAMPVRRGGGDFTRDTEAQRSVIGRWAGDRICLIGDYCQEDDVPGFDVTTIAFDADDLEDNANGVLFTDISELVVEVLGEVTLSKLDDGFAIPRWVDL